MKRTMGMLALLVAACLITTGSLFYPNDAEVLSIPEAGLMLVLPDGWDFSTRETAEPQPDTTQLSMDLDEELYLYGELENSHDYAILLTVYPHSEPTFSFESATPEEMDRMVEDLIESGETGVISWQYYGGPPWINHDLLLDPSVYIGVPPEEEGKLYQTEAVTILDDQMLQLQLYNFSDSSIPDEVADDFNELKESLLVIDAISPSADDGSVSVWDTDPDPWGDYDLDADGTDDSYYDDTYYEEDYGDSSDSIAYLLGLLLPPLISMLVPILIFIAVFRSVRQRQRNQRPFPQTPPAAGEMPVKKKKRKHDKKALPPDPGRQLPEINLEITPGTFRRTDLESFEARRDQVESLYRNGLLTREQLEKRLDELREYEKSRGASRWSL